MLNKWLLVYILSVLLFSISCNNNPTTSKNTSPTALFIVSPTSGDTGTIFNFDGSGSSDKEDAVSDLQVRWDWENDGVWDTDYRTIKTIVHQYPNPANYIVVLEVKDTEGSTDLSTFILRVESENTAPTASFTVSPTSGDTGTIFNFDGSGSGDNEDATTVLEVRWDWEDDGIWDTNYSTVKTITHQYTSMGTYSVKMEVKDSEGLVTTAGRTISVDSGNTAPMASFTVSPTSGDTGTIFNFDGSGSSDNEDANSALQFRWDFEDDGTWDTTFSSTENATHQYTSTGTYTVKMEVKDSGGLTSITFGTVSVSGVGNTAPTASFTTHFGGLQTNVGTTAGSFWFDGSGSSDNEDANSALQFRWDFEDDGTWDTTFSSTENATHQYTSTGTYTVKMEVKDSGGLTSITFGTVSVSGVGNTAPTASFTTHFGGLQTNVGTTAGSFWFDGSGSSDNEDANSALQFRWDFEDDGTWDTTFSSTENATHQYTSTGTYTVKMEVKDSGGLTSITFGTVSVSGVGNTAPTASFTTHFGGLQTNVGTTAGSFWFDGSGSSDNEDANSALQFRWDFEDDGTWDTTFSSTENATHQYTSTGTYTVKMEVKDSGGLTSITFGTVSVSGVGNTAPTASFTASPTSGPAGTNFSFDGSGSTDNEDATSVLEVRWDFENDGAWDTNYSTIKITAHLYSTPGTYTVKMEVKDSAGWVNVTTRNVSVTSANTAPTASFTTHFGGLQTNVGTTAGSFWFDGSGSSDNEDANSALQFRWDFEDDGAWDTTFSSNDDATHQYTSTGTYTIKLEVKDSAGWVNSATRTVIVN